MKETFTVICETVKKISDPVTEGYTIEQTKRPNYIDLNSGIPIF